MAILIYKKKNRHHFYCSSPSSGDRFKKKWHQNRTKSPTHAVSRSIKINDFIYSLWPYKRPEKDEQRGAEKKDRNEEKKRNREHRGRLEKQTRQKQGKRTKSQRTPASPCSSEHKHSRQTKTERLEHKNKRPETEDGRAEKLKEKTRKKPEEREENTGNKHIERTR